MKKILIISLIAVLGIAYIAAIYVFAKPLQEKVSTELKKDTFAADKTEWVYLGYTTITEVNDNEKIVNTFDRELYVRVIDNQFFYRVSFNTSNSISKYTRSQEYNAMYDNGKYRLNVPHW